MDRKDGETVKELGFAVKDPGDIVRGMHEYPGLTVWELCPECGNEVEIPAYGRSVCPECGAPILPCAMCARCTEPCVYEAISYNPLTYPELKEICYEGKCMSDLEWSLETGIPRMTLRYRIINGWPLDKVFSKEKFGYGKRYPGTKNKRYSAHAPTNWPGDISTRTVKEWSRISGIPTPVLYARLRSGMTMGQAIRAPYSPAEPPRMYTYDGKTMNVAEWAEETGIPIYTLYQRLREGRTIEEAVTMPYTPAKKKRSVPDLAVNCNRKNRLAVWLRRFRR